MNKYLISGFAGFVLAFGLMYATNPAYFGRRLPAMTDGSYTAYGILKMYNVRTGKPVYWIISGKGHRETLSGSETGYIEPDDIKLYAIPRDKLVGVAEADVPGASRIVDRIEVRGGIAYAVMR